MEQVRLIRLLVRGGVKENDGRNEREGGTMGENGRNRVRGAVRKSNGSSE